MESSTQTPLNEVELQFILEWGELGLHWGISRHVGQVFALLYLSPDPLCLETIATTLQMTNAHAGTAVKVLLDWRLIFPFRELGVRRTSYMAIEDIWLLMSRIVTKRKQIELDSALEAVDASIALYNEENLRQPYLFQRLAAMHKALFLINTVYRLMVQIPLDIIVDAIESNRFAEALFNCFKPTNKKEYGLTQEDAHTAG